MTVRRPLRSRTLVLAVGLALVATGCSLGDAPTPGVADDGAGPTSYRIAPDCPPPPAEPPAVSVDLLNTYLAETDLPAWQAADIGASTQLSDGRLVWVFGDTVRTDAYSPQVVSNSMLVSSGVCAGQVLPDGDGPIVPDTTTDLDGGGEVVHWPMSVVALEPGHEFADGETTDVLVVLTARTRRGGTGNDAALDYAFLGTTASVFTVTAGGAPTLVESMEVTPDDASLDQVNWGAAATVTDDWFYVYGTRQVEGSFGRELHVARVPVDDPRDRSRWEFWDGGDWQAEIGSSVAVLPADGGVSQTLSVDALDPSGSAGFVAVSKQDGDLGDFATVWSAPAPYGPWTQGDRVPAPAGFDTGNLLYAPLAHPEIELADGRLLVSVSRNTTDFGRLLAEPTEVGRPVFTEIDRP